MTLCSAEPCIISCLPTHVINLVINDNSLEILYLYYCLLNVVPVRPSVVRVQEANVHPDTRQKGSLVCWFEGHPNQVTWTKNGKVVSAVPGKVYLYTELREHTGIVVGKLKIANVVAKDFGLYRCNGSNDYGFAVGAVQLISKCNIINYLVSSVRSWCGGSSDRSFMGWTH